jgi:hypothetical protein
MRPGQSRLSRRAFLQAGAAGAAALAFKLFAPFPAASGGVSPLTIAATRPLAYPHHYIADPDTLPRTAWPAADVLLVPAYTAAELIARGDLLSLRGELPLVPGRPHDPEGAFTRPQGVAWAALVTRAGAPPPALADLWQADAVWLDSARLALGVALMRRGYSPNDSHSGHLALCERDLQALRPRLASDPAARLRAGAAAVALTLVSGPALPGGLAAAMPAEGALYSEYDWVVPRRAARVEAALAFLRAQPAVGSAAWPVAARRVPLAPLPVAGRAQHAAIWARLRGAWPEG